MHGIALGILYLMAAVLVVAVVGAVVVSTTTYLAERVWKIIGGAAAVLGLALLAFLIRGTIGVLSLESPPLAFGIYVVVIPVFALSLWPASHFVDRRQIDYRVVVSVLFAVELCLVFILGIIDPERQFR